jgi:hypothetical protein
MGSTDDIARTRHPQRRAAGDGLTVTVSEWVELPASDVGFCVACLGLYGFFFHFLPSLVSIS